MKNIQVVLLILLAVLSSSCASYYVSSKRVMELKQGMTQQEVRQLLGKVDYRRFDGGFEEWEFRRDQGTPIVPDPVTIIVQFLDGEVVSMDTHGGYGIPVPPIR